MFSQTVKHIQCINSVRSILVFMFNWDEMLYTMPAYSILYYSSISDGTILCAAGCGTGEIKLFVLSVQSCADTMFKLHSSLVSSFHPTGVQAGTHVCYTISISFFYSYFAALGRLTDLLMVPDTNGCVLHICCDGSNLLKWSVRDIDNTGGNYQVLMCISTEHAHCTCLATVYSACSLVAEGFLACSENLL